MLTIKHITNDGVNINTVECVRFVDNNYGKDELMAHISDLNIESPTDHFDMIAAVFFKRASLYIYPGDQLYITDSGGNTIHSIR